MTLEGIDVSSWNPHIDWEQAAAGGIAFAFVKASEGVGYNNPLHATQVACARATTVTLHDGDGQMTYHGPFGVGHYHYARPDESTPEDEAAYFLGVLGTHESGEPLALDLERDAPGVDLNAWALTWLERVAVTTGVRPFLYTYPNYEKRDLTAPGLATFPLWLASYDGEVTPLAPWSSVAVWQYAGDAADVPGCGDPTDRNRFVGTVEDFKALGTPLAAATPPPYGPYNVPLGGGFLQTYRAAPDALARWGYPVTPERTETIDGHELTVQYFERGRFEYDQRSGLITFGLVGLELARARGYMT